MASTDFEIDVWIPASARRFGLTYMQRRNIWGLVFALPAMVFFALFAIFPILRTFYLSFFEYDVVTEPTYVGLKNFRGIVGDDRFNDSLLASFRYVAYTYIPVWILALLLALALNTRIKARGLFRTIYFVPVVMSWVVVSVIWKLVFHRNGLLNTMFLDSVGIPPKNWLTDVNLAPDAITLMSAWKEAGLLHGDFPGWAADDPFGSLRGRQSRRLDQLPGLPPYHLAPAPAHHPLRHRDRAGHRPAGLHPPIRHDPGRPGELRPSSSPSTSTRPPSSSSTAAKPPPCPSSSSPSLQSSPSLNSAFTAHEHTEP